MDEYLLHIEGILPMSYARVRSKTDPGSNRSKICINISSETRGMGKQVQIILSCNRASSGDWVVVDVLLTKVYRSSTGALLEGSLTHVDLLKGAKTKSTLDAKQQRPDASRDLPWNNTTKKVPLSLLRWIVRKVAIMPASQRKIGVQVLSTNPPHLVISGSLLQLLIPSGFNEDYIAQCYKYGLHVRGAPLDTDTSKCRPHWSAGECDSQSVEDLKVQIQANAAPSGQPITSRFGRMAQNLDKGRNHLAQLLKHKSIALPEPRNASEASPTSSAFTSETESLTASPTMPHASESHHDQETSWWRRRR